MPIHSYRRWTIPNTNYTAGRAREYRTMELLNLAGYRAHRMAGSHGTWDVIGIGQQTIILVQVKYNCRPTATEWEAMRLYEAPSNAEKIVHCYTRGKREPLVLPVGKEV